MCIYFFLGINIPSGDVIGLVRACKQDHATNGGHAIAEYIIWLGMSLYKDLGCKSIYSSGAKIFKNTTTSKILYLKNFNSQLQYTAIFGS